MSHVSASTLRAGSRVFLVGIGGIGMSAIAQWLQRLGYSVSGTDRASSDVVLKLHRQGISVAVAPHGVEVPNDTDVLVYSAAVPPQDPAFSSAVQRGVRHISYAEALGALLSSYRVVAVTGSHGKSTTTALVALLLRAAGVDPTAVIGTFVPGLGGTNFVFGQSDVAVCEADEYRGHFLTLSPLVTVITGVDHDHVDAFPTPESYQDAFQRLIGNTAESGTVVLHAADASTPALARACGSRERVLFALLKSATAAPAAVGRKDLPDALVYTATLPAVRDGRQLFTVYRNARKYGEFTLRQPGHHLIKNALAALGAVSRWDVSAEIARRVFDEYQGTWRRFEVVGNLRGAPVISDYAHHPTELRALLQAARQWYPSRRVLLVFQPHQRARTKAFSQAFQRVLAEADAVILAEVYDVAGREDLSDATSSRPWVESIGSRGVSAQFAPTLDDAEQLVRESARENDVILVAGAGTIDRVARQLAGAA